MKKAHKTFCVGNIWVFGISLGRCHCFILSPCSLGEPDLTPEVNMWSRDSQSKFSDFLAVVIASSIDLNTCWAANLHLCVSYWEVSVFCVLWLPALITMKTWSFYWLSLKMKPTQRICWLRGEGKKEIKMTF